MFSKDISLSEENEKTKLLEAEQADPGQISSFTGTYRSLEAFALTASGILLLLLIVAYIHTIKCKNMVEEFSSGNELHNVVANETSSDTFVYAMTYDPGFCYKKQESEWPGCFRSNKEWTKKLTIHGLWPEFENGTWPEFCSKEKLNSTLMRELINDIYSVWPDLQNDPSEPFEKTEFYEHEWTKHGTCSGMSQRAYFTTALSLYVVPTPHTFIKDHYGGKVHAKDITEAFGGENIAFPQCKGGYLEGISFCVHPKTGNMSPVSCSVGIKRELERNQCKGTVALERFFERQNSKITEVARLSNYLQIAP